MKNVLSVLVNFSRLLRNYLQRFSDRFILHHSSCSGLATRSALDDVCHVLCHAFANSFRTYLVVQSNTDVLCFRRFIFTFFAPACRCVIKPWSIDHQLRQSQRLMRYLPIPIVRVYFIYCTSMTYKMNDAIISRSSCSGRLLRRHWNLLQIHSGPQIRAQSTTST